MISSSKACSAFAITDVIALLPALEAEVSLTISSNWGEDAFLQAATLLCLQCILMLIWFWRHPPVLRNVYPHCFFVLALPTFSMDELEGDVRDTGSEDDLVLKGVTHPIILLNTSPVLTRAAVGASLQESELGLKRSREACCPPWASSQFMSLRPQHTSFLQPQAAARTREGHLRQPFLTITSA